MVNREGENLGKIEDLMVDMSEGRVAYAVLSFGGFLNMGNKLFAVPFSSLQCDCEQEKLILSVDKEQLENLHKHYGEQPYWQNY